MPGAAAAPLMCALYCATVVWRLVSSLGDTTGSVRQLRVVCGMPAGAPCAAAAIFGTPTGHGTRMFSPAEVGTAALGAQLMSTPKFAGNGAAGTPGQSPVLRHQ